jgi:hypothetical protein
MPRLQPLASRRPSGSARLGTGRSGCKMAGVRRRPLGIHPETSASRRPFVRTAHGRRREPQGRNAAPADRPPPVRRERGQARRQSGHEAAPCHPGNVTSPRVRHLSEGNTAAREDRPEATRPSVSRKVALAGRPVFVRRKQRARKPPGRNAPPPSPRPCVASPRARRLSEGNTARREDRQNPARGGQRRGGAAARGPAAVDAVIRQLDPAYPVGAIAAKRPRISAHAGRG